jgi:hypothetical protein
MVNLILQRQHKSLFQGQLTEEDDTKIVSNGWKQKKKNDQHVLFLNYIFYA